MSSSSSSNEKRSCCIKWLSKLFETGAENKELRSSRRHPQPSGNGNTDNQVRADENRGDLDQPKNFTVCGGCKRDIEKGLCPEFKGVFYHPQCFCCCACGHTITSGFSISEGKAYHNFCFRELTHPKCYVCHQFLPLNEAGIEYCWHPFWLQKYCPSHDGDGTARCCSCERLVSSNGECHLLVDGRMICSECMESAIMVPGDSQPLYCSIRKYYEGLSMKIKQQIPMLLVEREAMNEGIKGEKHGFHDMPEIRGLCISERRIVCRLTGWEVTENSIDYRFRCRTMHHVAAIVALYGLPRLLTGAIIAHELMHVWLREHGYRNLTPDVEEGICQLLSHMWLESEVISLESMASSSSSPKKVKRTSTGKKLGEFFMHQIANDPSPTYGDGYRAAAAAAAAVNKYDLRRTLDQYLKALRKGQMPKTHDATS